MAKVGRPPMFKSPEELEKKIHEYFEHCKETKELLTITGLCLWCGFESRQSFYSYEKKPEFSYTIKKAHLGIEHGYELKLTDGKAQAGIIFALKNLGWTDKQEIEHGISPGSNNKFNITFRSEPEPDKTTGV